MKRTILVILALTTVGVFAADAPGAVHHETAEADDRGLGAPAAEIDDEAADRLRDRELGAERRAGRLGDEEHLAPARRTRLAGGFRRPANAPAPREGSMRLAIAASERRQSAA